MPAVRKARGARKTPAARRPRPAADADFEVTGRNPAALFTLKLHRGEGMTLIAMNWRSGPPPQDFVGFAIEYQEPGGKQFYAVKNRLGFPAPGGAVSGAQLATTVSPIQKFRWVHFPRNAELAGEFVYRITPVFMNDADALRYGEPQQAKIQLRRETYPGVLNVAFTRGFVSSQAFVDRFVPTDAQMTTLLPANADQGLDFVPTYPQAKQALAWMGFEALEAILGVLDQAIRDRAQVRVVAYDLNERDVVARLEKLGPRLQIVIDDSADHGAPDSAETQAAARLAATAGAAHVKRQHMGNLQHNKTIVVDGPRVKAVVCGSTNFSWRGLFVQSNNAVVLHGESAVQPFRAAFDDYWQHSDAGGFSQTGAAEWSDLGLPGIDAHVAFSPHSARNALLAGIASDIGQDTTSSLFYSLAFLYQTPGPIRDAIEKVTKSDSIFVYGVSDKPVGGLDLQKPNGNVAPVSPAWLTKNLPEPFKSEPSGGPGIRMHHKFVVIDFDQPTARVYLGSYNFSAASDIENGENLVLIKDRRVAVAYMVEALRIFDHYHFRVTEQDASQALKSLALTKPPRQPGAKPWWAPYYADARKIRDRELFA